MAMNGKDFVVSQSQNVAFSGQIVKTFKNPFCDLLPSDLCVIINQLLSKYGSFQLST